jgi:hypothetical protein
LQVCLGKQRSDAYARVDALNIPPERIYFLPKLTDPFLRSKIALHFDEFDAEGSEFFSGT